MNRVSIPICFLALVTLAETVDGSPGALSGRGDVLVTHTLYAEEIILTREQPYSRDLRITFLGVSDEGFAYLRFKNEKTLKAQKGDGFACEEFGRRGLLYIDSTSDKRSITLRRFTCETTKTEKEK